MNESALQSDQPAEEDPARPPLAGIRADQLDVLCIAVAVAAAVLVAVNERNPARAVTVGLFAVFIPGRAIVSNWHFVQDRPTTPLAVLLSLSILTLAATVTVWAKFWRPLGLLEVECGVSAALLLLAVFRRRRPQAPAGGAEPDVADVTEAEAEHDA